MSEWDFIAANCTLSTKRESLILGSVLQGGIMGFNVMRCEREGKNLTDSRRGKKHVTYDNFKITTKRRK